MATTTKYGIYYDDPTMIAKGQTQDKTQALSIETALGAAVVEASPYKQTRLAAGADLDALPSGVYFASNETDAAAAGVPGGFPAEIDTTTIGAQGGVQRAQALDGRVLRREKFRGKWSPWIREDAGHINRAHVIQGLLARKGGSIGTGGKGVISLRFDEDHQIFREQILPLLEARHLPYTQVSTAEATGGQVIAQAEFETMETNALRAGGEIWCKGKNGSDGNGTGEVYEELIAAKSILQGKTPRVPIDCMGGLKKSTKFNNFMFANAPDRFTETFAGVKVMETYAIVAAYFQDFYWYQLDGHLKDGFNEYGMSTSTYDQMVTRANVARDNVVGIMMQFSPSALAGNLPAFTQFLDYLVQQRQRENLEVLTVSGMAAADSNSSKRHDLISGEHDSVVGSTTYTATVRDVQFRKGTPGSTRELRALVKGAPGSTVTSVIGTSTASHTVPASGWLNLFHQATIPLNVTGSLTVSISAYAQDVHLYAI